MGEKYVVVIGHGDRHAICLKATSKTAIYRNNPDKMAGCVYLKAAEVAFFREDTVIQPDNQFPVPHSSLEDESRILGSLPEDFQGRLIRAVESSSTIPTSRKRSLLECIT